MVAWYGRAELDFLSELRALLLSTTLTFNFFRLYYLAWG